MVNQPFLDWQFPTIGSTGATSLSNRTLQSRMQEIVDVRDYGAVGDGVTNDTAAIQAAIDAAWGPSSNPYSAQAGLAYFQNKALYFPSGQYLVNPTINNRAVTGSCGTVGLPITLTVNTTGISSWENVTIAGVTGTTEANGTWFVTIIDGTHLSLNLSQFFNAYTGGGTLTNGCLHARSIVGGLMYGNGRTSELRAGSSNTSVFYTNGCINTHFRDLGFNGNVGGTSFQLDWDNTGVASLYNNTFTNCAFGSGTNTDYGLKIGAGLVMGDTTVLVDCTAIHCAVAGVYLGNQNALHGAMYGGNISQCTIGIYVPGGAWPVISGVGFQTDDSPTSTSGKDIVITGVGGSDGYHISGCRSESRHFLYEAHAGSGVTIEGCVHSNRSSQGRFAWIEATPGAGQGSLVINNCGALGGTIGGNGKISVTGSYLVNNDPFSTLTGLGSVEVKQTTIGFGISRDVIHQMIRPGRTRTLDIESADVSGSSEFLYDGYAQPVNFTAATDVITGTNNFVAGDPVFFEVSSAGVSSGQVYYVHATGLSTTQFSVSSAVGSSIHNLTADSAGTQTCAMGRRYAVGDQILHNTVTASSNPGWICTTAGVASSAVFRALAACS